MARKAKADRKSRILKKPQKIEADEAAPIQDRYRLVGIYQRLRRKLLSENDPECLEQSLAYWVLPTDRRLPLALLDWQLKEVLECSLDELMMTPGIGQKKIMGLFDLLGRAANRHRVKDPFVEATNNNARTTGRTFRKDSAHSPSQRRSRKLIESPANFDPTVVSEEVWSTWCQSILDAGFKNQKLGRIAPCLRPLPTVIWDKKLEDYASLRLAEIRELKTHGEKRVHAILEVFFVVYEAVSTSVMNEHLDLQLTPRFVPKLNDWLIATNGSAAGLSKTTVKKKLLEPILDQLELDLGTSIAQLASDRLLYKSKAPTILQHANKMRVTRARIYQLLEDCARVMEVRWPEGKLMLQPLLLDAAKQPYEASKLLFATVELLFPTISKSEHRSEAIER